MFSQKYLALALSVIFLALCAATNSFGNKTEITVKEIEITQKNQVKISLSSKETFSAFALENPDRLVIDIKNAKIDDKASKPKLPDFISSFRHTNKNGALRLVFDLNQKAKIETSSFEKISKEKFGKIVVLLKLSEPNKIAPKLALSTTSTATPNPKLQDFVSAKVEEFDVQTRKVINPDGSSKYVVTKTPKKSETTPRIPIIIIDSGHGGKDPGTIGNYARSKEKNITLSYAKELGKQILLTGHYKVFLTRSTDHFIQLKERVAIARRKKADLFISLHANSSPNNATEGFSIYTLSETSSDKQAELLAQKENRADIINGIDFSEASQDIMKTLIDMSQRESKNSSSRFAAMVVKSMKASEVNILQNSHRFAGFAVLTAPDMASVLIELGYLSNKNEEKLLNSISYKRLIAKSVVDAINEYFGKR